MRHGGETSVGRTARPKAAQAAQAAGRANAVDNAAAVEAANVAGGGAGGAEVVARRDARIRVRPRTLAFVVTLAAIVVAAAVLRFADISTNPGGMYGDEASEGLDALRLLHQPGFHADWLVWFQSDGGREALFAYVVAAAFSLFGDSALILRETAAAIGVAGVLAIAVLGRRWGMATALVAAAWAAGSLWLICVSRDGMRNTIVPFFGAIALIAMLRWASRPSRGTAIVAGAVTALSTLYTYQPLKLLPLLLVVWLFWLRRANRGEYERLRPGIVPGILAFLVVGAPMLAVAITEPASFFGRATAVSVLNPGVVADVPYPIHILRTILMFGFFGDGNGRHNVASLPLLPIPLVLIGLLGPAPALAKPQGPRRVPHPAEPADLHPAPVALPGRILAALPAGAWPRGPARSDDRARNAGTLEIARRRWPRAAYAPGLAAALVAATLAGVAVWSGFVYLDRSVADRWDWFSYPATAIADAAREQPNTAVILGGFDTVDVEYLDYHAMPAMIEPGTVIPNPKVYSRILAPSQTDLVRSLGPELGGRAKPVAFDPSGRAAVWAVVP